MFQNVFANETLCFNGRNTLFQRPKHFVSKAETLCFKGRNKTADFVSICIAKSFLLAAYFQKDAAVVLCAISESSNIFLLSYKKSAKNFAD